MIEKRIAVGYVRVSSLEQSREGLSIDAQIRRIQKYSDMMGWELSKIYRDEGRSGKDIKGRKGFKEMLLDTKKRNRKFSAVVVNKFDRAFRSSRDAILTIEQLGSLNIDIVSVSENIDTTTPMGKAMFTIITVFSQLERDLTSQRVREIHQDKFSRGEMLGKAPVGYKWNKRKKRMFVDKEKAEMVRDIFQMTVSGATHKQILEKHEIGSKMYYSILKNKVYIGMVQFGGQEKKGNHESIVSEELFHKANLIPRWGFNKTGL